MSTLPGDSTIAGASTAPQAGRTASTRYHRPRRAFGDAVLHAPQTLRALVRTDEIWLVVLSAFVGCGAGIAVWLMTETTQLIHQVLFRISASERLSAMVELDPIRTVAVPTLGGLLIGLIGLAVVRYHPRRAVDPIEANALYGGRMSLNDSVIVVAADDPVERRRCVGGAGGRLHPDRLGHGVPLRPHVPRPAQRPAAAGGLRRGRRHRRRVQRTAHRRLLRLRAGDRHLLPRHLRPGRGRRHRGGLRGQRSRRRTVRSRAPGAHPRRGAGLHPDPRPRHGLCSGGHRHHARRDADRGPVPQERRPGLDPPDVRRTRRRCVSLDDASGTVLRPWRAGRGHRGALHAAPCDDAGGAEIDRLGDLDRVRLPRRAVLCLAVPGRAGGQGVCRCAGRCRVQRTPCRRWSARWWG